MKHCHVYTHIHARKREVHLCAERVHGCVAGGVRMATEYTRFTKTNY